MNSRHQRAPVRPTSVPIHRGPGAVTAGTSGPGAFHAAPNAALLIDFDNVTMGIRSDLQSELRNLLSSDIVKGKIAIQRAYADWRRYPQYVLPLTESSIDLIYAPAYGSSKKNATDIRLAIDAMELVFTRPEIGTIILLSGDSDFSSLVIKLKEYGKYIIGVGIRESSSDLLVQNCDEYYSYNALAGLVRTSEDSPRHDPWELVTEAITRMKKNGDVMRSDRLKQVMVEIDPNFDEKDLGMPKFSRFCQEAAQRGLLSVSKLENGQLEVDLPGAAKGAAPAQPARPAREAAPAAAPATADAAAKETGDEERKRRSRRGRGGRGRDRERPAGAVEPAAGEAVPVAAAPARTEPPRVATEARTPARPPRESVRAQSAAAAPEASGAADEIGIGGELLTRDEAFNLVRRAVEALTTDPEHAVRASAVRVKARELLGRDSGTLADRHFGRILRDAHDAEVIDLRRRGDDFEVARSAEAAPVAEQLKRAADAAPAPSAPSAPAAPRGMGPRGGGPGRGGRAGFGTRVGAPPPELLAIGVVGAQPARAAAASESTEAEAPVTVRASTGRKTAARKSAAKKSAAKTTAATKTAAKKPGRPAAKKAAKSTRAAAAGAAGGSEPAAKTTRPRAKKKAGAAQGK